MFIIRRIEDGMWLVGYIRSTCPVPTCLWGQRWEDARLFESQWEAEAMARKCGGEAVLLRPREEGEA